MFVLSILIEVRLYCNLFAFRRMTGYHLRIFEIVFMVDVGFFIALVLAALSYVSFASAEHLYNEQLLSFLVLRLFLINCYFNLFLRRDKLCGFIAISEDACVSDGNGSDLLIRHLRLLSVELSAYLDLSSGINQFILLISRLSLVIFGSTI